MMLFGSIRDTLAGHDSITTDAIQQRVLAETTEAATDVLASVVDRATDGLVERIAGLPRGARHAVTQAALTAQRLEDAIRAGRNRKSCSCNGHGPGGTCSCGGRKCACKGRGMFRRTAGGQWITADVCEDGRCCDYL
jgi:hypothetical protein